MGNAVFDYIHIDDVDYFQFIRIPKFLFSDDKTKNLSSNAKILYGLLLDRTSLSKVNKWVDEQGRVFIRYSEENICEDLNCSRPTVRKALESLDTKKGVGLIERKRVGLGRADEIYVKGFVVRETHEEENKDSENTELPEEKENDNRKEKELPSEEKEKNNSSGKKNTPNHTNGSQTDSNDTKSNHILSQDKKGYDELQFELDGIIDNLELDSIYEDKPYMKDFLERIKDIISETYMTCKESIKISGEEYSIQMIRERLEKLDQSCMLYLYECITNNTVKVKNQKQYLLKSIINAPLTLSAYYANKVKVNN